jgi:hypothetical protein
MSLESSVVWGTFEAHAFDRVNRTSYADDMVAMFAQCALDQQDKN